MLTRFLRRRDLPAATDATSQVHAGFALHRIGDIEGALRCYRLALELQPRNGDALYLCGIAETSRGETDAALDLLTRATQHDATNAHAWFALGELLRARGDPVRAAEALEAGLARDPNDPARYDQLAELRIATGAPCGAEAAARTAIELDPAHAEGWIALGAALRAQGLSRQATECFERACELDPNAAAAWHNRLLTLNYVDDLPAAHVAAAHLDFGARFEQRPGDIFRTAAPPADRPLRVGFVSADFGHHVVSFFIEPVLAALDRSAIEAFCYFNGAREDEQSRRLRALVPHWRSIANLDDASALALIRDDLLDIAVDLSGHTAGNRLPLFAQRIAPVQTTWLGYPATTGLATMDYRLTDALADPPGMTEAFHSERLMRLPDGFLCFQPRADAPAVTALPAATSGRVTFASFNNLAKLTETALGAWGRILEQVPDSRLLLKGHGLEEASLCRALATRFANAGGDAGRLTMEGIRAPHEAHLARYGEVDVALDSMPYCGTTTTCEALWMGVPVVTLAGASHAARVGASLLDGIGHGEWIAEDLQQYVDIAVRLASDTAMLAKLRASLRAEFAAASLVDAHRFARELESALREMVQAC